MSKDHINPNHYHMYGVQAIDILAAELSREGMIGYLKGNVFKYAFRAGNKGTVDDARVDIDKAIWYLSRLKEEL